MQAVTYPRPGRPPPRPRGDQGRPSPGHPPARRRLPGLRGPGRLTGLADTAPAHRRPDQPRAAGHRRPDTAYLLTQAGLFLYDQGQLGRAARHLQRVLASYVRVLGADHPDTLGSRDHLVGAYKSAGDPGRVIRLYEQILADTIACGCRAPTIPRPDRAEQPRRGAPAFSAVPARLRAGPWEVADMPPRRMQAAIWADPPGARVL
jgi:hypothetical protein